MKNYNIEELLEWLNKSDSRMNYLKDRSYLLVLSGQLEQILGIIRLFGFT